MSIRNTAKALLVHNNKLLLNKCINSTGYEIGGIQNGELYYDLPGGGQHLYETLEEALQRECLEETGYRVEVGRLVGCYEEICLSAPLRQDYPDYAHKIYFIFVCRLKEESLQPATEQDIDQLESKWVDISELKQLSFYPLVLRSAIEGLLKAEAPVFLGSRRI